MPGAPESHQASRRSRCSLQWAGLPGAEPLRVPLRGRGRDAKAAWGRGSARLWRGLMGSRAGLAHGGACARAAAAAEAPRLSPGTAWRCALASAALARRGDAGGASNAGALPKRRLPTANRTRTPKRSASRRALRRSARRGLAGARAPRSPRAARCWSCHRSCWWRSSPLCPAQTCPAWPKCAPSSGASCTPTPFGDGAAGRVSAPEVGVRAWEGPRTWKGLKTEVRAAGAWACDRGRRSPRALDRFLS